MHYMLQIYMPDLDSEATLVEGHPERAAWEAYTKALIDAGVLRGGEELVQPRLATTVRLRGGRTEIHDGPFADSKEQLGGFYLIDVPDLDSAIAWAARCPGAGRGAIELRPLARSS